MVRRNANNMQLKYDKRSFAESGLYHTELNLFLNGVEFINELNLTLKGISNAVKPDHDRAIKLCYIFTNIFSDPLVLNDLINQYIITTWGQLDDDEYFFGFD